MHQLEHHGAHGVARERAAVIEDGALRRCFLREVPENQRTLELAKEWLSSG